jgi:hypothetical protein
MKRVGEDGLNSAVSCGTQIIAIGNVVLLMGTARFFESCAHNAGISFIVRA